MKQTKKNHLKQIQINHLTNYDHCRQPAFHPLVGKHYSLKLVVHGQSDSNSDSLSRIVGVCLLEGDKNKDTLTSFVYFNTESQASPLQITTLILCSKQAN